MGDVTQLYPAASSERGKTRRPKIVVSSEMPRVIDQTLAALTGARELFRRGGHLVEVVTDRPPRDGIGRPPGVPVIVAVGETRLRELAAREAEWLVEEKEGEFGPCMPPTWVPKGVVERKQWHGIRPLEGVIDVPVLRPDGSLVDAPGYDERTGLLYLPGTNVADFSARPSAEDVRAALARLLEIVRDFPFASPSGRAAWLSQLITPFVRWAFNGCLPLGLIEANTRASGKGLMADTIGIPFTGRSLARMSHTRNEEEMRKRIFSVLLGGNPILLIDNVEGSLGDPALNALLTSEEWEDRILGKSQMKRLRVRALILATANNVELSADTPRRTICIRLESPEERPERRSDIRHPNLRAWVRSERSRIVADILTLLLAYQDAGCPAQGLTPMGSYEEWSRWVREPIVWLGLPDPWEEPAPDAEHLALQQLLVGLATWRGLGIKFFVGDLLERTPEHIGCEAKAALSDLLGTPDLDAHAVGHLLKRYRKRVVAGLCLDRGERAERGVPWVVRTAQLPSASPVDPVDPVDPDESC